MGSCLPTPSEFKLDSKFQTGFDWLFYYYKQAQEALEPSEGRAFFNSYTRCTRTFLGPTTHLHIGTDSHKPSYIQIE